MLVKEAEKLLYYFFIIKSLIGALIYSKFHSPNVINITVMILYFTRIKYPSLIVKKNSEKLPFKPRYVIEPSLTYINLTLNLIRWCVHSSLTRKVNRKPSALCIYCLCFVNRILHKTMWQSENMYKTQKQVLSKSIFLREIIG